MRIPAGQPLRVLELATVTTTGGLEFRIQRPLKNFNSRNRNAHWSVKNKSRLEWQMAFANALVGAVGINGAQTRLASSSGLFGAQGDRPVEKRVVSILRLCPSRRQFIRDDFDNLRWATKELRDALKQCGLIRDDSSKWCDTSISQDVSGDGTYWTIVTIETPREEARS